MESCTAQRIRVEIRIQEVTQDNETGHVLEIREDHWEETKEEIQELSRRIAEEVQRWQEDMDVRKWYPIVLVHS